MARPKKPAPETRSVRLNLRFTPTEWIEIAPRIAVSGLAPTEFCQRAVLGSLGPEHTGPPQKVERVDPALVVAINRVGVNLNQIARSLNSGNGFVPVHLDELLVRVNQYLDQVQE